MPDYNSRAYYPEGMQITSQENREYLSSLAGLERAIYDDVILEAMAVMCDSDLNLTVDLCGMRGIIPKSEAAYCTGPDGVKDIAVITRVGKAVCFKVKAVNRDRKGAPEIILSRRMAQEECMHRYLMKLTPGDIVDAKVTHLEHFGAFVDIGCGIVSLMSIDCISVSRISHPRDRFSPGTYIRAVIRNIDYETGRICVSHKELLGTWQENASRFAVGQTVAGIVRSIEDYGIFIELAPNLAGLAERRNREDGSCEVMVGQTAAVFVKNIIPERMKIKLVLIDSYKGELIPRRMEYFLGDNETHIDYWRYSPRGCGKVIETNFMAMCGEEELRPTAD